MKYLIIEDHGYAGYQPKEFTSYSELGEYCAKIQIPVYGIYRISEELSLKELLYDYLDRKEAQQEEARSKLAASGLTGYELSLLGYGLVV